MNNAKTHFVNANLEDGKVFVTMTSDKKLDDHLPTMALSVENFTYALEHGCAQAFDRPVDLRVTIEDRATKTPIEHTISFVPSRLVAA